MTFYTARLKHDPLPMAPALFEGRKLAGVALFTSEEKLSKHLKDRTSLEWDLIALDSTRNAEELLLALDGMLAFCGDFRSCLSLPVFVDPADHVFRQDIKPDYESVSSFLKASDLFSSLVKVLSIEQYQGFTIVLNELAESQVLAVVCRGLYDNITTVRDTIGKFMDDGSEDINSYIVEEKTAEAALSSAKVWIELTNKGESPE